MDLVLKNVRLQVQDATGSVTLGEHPLSEDELRKLNDDIIEELLFGKEQGMEMMGEFAESKYEELGEPHGEMDDVPLLCDITWDTEYIESVPV